LTLVTVAGPPSSGKTSVLVRVLGQLRARGIAGGVVKFDCLASNDAAAYAKAGIPVQTGLSGNLCPDHFFITNIERCAAWAESRKLDLLVAESAGLCNRCAPHIKGALAVCVLDNLSGVDTPLKVGPMLRTADLVLITKGDIVSQAEREVYAWRIKQANRSAEVVFVNGINGQGVFDVVRIWLSMMRPVSLHGARLRFPVPAAVCSYCLGETKIGEEFQKGNVKELKIKEAE
jgi:Ni2+-binding GTPase involved in maturation of urease and hydrogenase